MFVLTKTMKADGVSDDCGHFNTFDQAAEPVVVLQNVHFYKRRKTQSPSPHLHFVVSSVKMELTFIFRGIHERIVGQPRTWSVKRKPCEDGS